MLKLIKQNILQNVIAIILFLRYSFKADETLANSNEPLDSFSFVALGDTGGTPYFPYTSRNGRIVAKTLENWAFFTKPSFALLLGDNFYDKGVTSINDSRFAESFENLYPSPSLKIPWYITAGNHDHRGSVKAQIAYSNISTRWTYPYYYYEKLFSINIPSSNSQPFKNGNKTTSPSNDQNKIHNSSKLSYPTTPLNDSLESDTVLKVHLIGIDTVILCGKRQFLFRENYWLPEKLRFTTTDWDESETAKQQFWIEETLKTSKADFIIVFGHYPIYSIGKHGPSVCLRRRLNPLLKKYRVNAYVSGHDHNQQLFIDEVQPTKHHNTPTNHTVNNINELNFQPSIISQDTSYLSNLTTHNIHYIVLGSGSKLDQKTTHKTPKLEKMLKFFQGDLNGYGGFGYFRWQPFKNILAVQFIDGLGRIRHDVEISPRFGT